MFFTKVVFLLLLKFGSQIVLIARLSLLLLREATKWSLMKRREVFTMPYVASGRTVKLFPLRVSSFLIRKNSFDFHHSSL